jgi:hypothetical protein
VLANPEMLKRRRWSSSPIIVMVVVVIVVLVVERWIRWSIVVAFQWSES